MVCPSRKGDEMDMFTNCSLSDYDDLPDNEIFELDGKKYIKADGILTEIVSHRGNVYRVKHINSDSVTYLLNDGASIWSHGDTLAEAKADLLYKISNRDTSAYTSFDLHTELSLDDAVECYRAITGACVLGIKMFLNATHFTKSMYTVKELIEMTRNKFGNTKFEDFFKK